MEKDVFMITGKIERLKELSAKMEKKLFEQEDVDFEEIGEPAEEADDCVNNLINECVE